MDLERVSRKTELANYSDGSNLADMPKGSSRIASLLNRVRAATAAHGAKTKLANAIGVRPAQISDWLAPNGKTPSAEHALALQEWLTGAEANPKKTPDVLLAHPARKAKTSRTVHAKKGSGPPKK